jgi:hypothetical protein
MRSLAPSPDIANESQAQDTSWWLTNNAGEAVKAILAATPETPLGAIEPEMSTPPAENPVLPLESAP